MAKKNLRTGCVGSIISVVVMAILICGNALIPVPRAQAQAPSPVPTADISIQRIDSLEQRVQKLEQQNTNQEDDITRLTWSKFQLQAWIAGDNYFAVLHSTNDHYVVFGQDLSWVQAPYEGDRSVYPYTCMCRIGDNTQISLYDNKGNFIDSFDYTGIVKPGDILVAWYTETNPSAPNGLPNSPDALHTEAYYWSKSGLAISIQHIDGTYYYK